MALVSTDRMLEMPLPTGSWSAVANGQRTTLVIASVDASGLVAGTYAGTAISGLWDEITQRLTFGPPGFYDLEIFTAFLFEDQFRMPGIIGGTVYTLAGHYTDASSGVTDVDRPTFGWYAQIGLR